MYKRQEEKVPEELKLGYREDIERKDGKSADGAGGGSGAVESSETLSSKDEGSLHPNALPTQPQPTFQHSELSLPQDQPLPPAPQPQAATIPASVPVPVTTTQAQPPTIQPQTAQQQQQLAAAPTANSWIDLAIVGIAVMLGAMVVRKLLLLNE